ncbi:MAG: hypothetical protein ACYTGH_16245, partial [Planctomycetota bacterium]
LVGAILLAAKHDLPYDAIADSVRAAAAFAAFGEDGKSDAGDAAFHEEFDGKGLAAVLNEVAGLDPSDVLEADILNALSKPEPPRT